MLLLLTLLAWIPFYLIGAYPTGFLIARARGVNILEHGSGNVGATNVARTLGAKAGLLTLIGDILKGALAVSAAKFVSTDAGFVCGAAVACLAGHCFSLPPKLKGGKGVAVSLGITLMLSPLAALGGLTIFVVMVLAFRVVSVASVTAAFAASLTALFTSAPEQFSRALMLMSFIILFRHRQNLRRLIEGNESKFRFDKLYLKH
jgi:acyl phosphate:glycerol-3-phosphate acyltransferase